MTNTKIDRTSLQWMQIGFYATLIIFNLCLIAQGLTVGVTYFDDPAQWTMYVWLVREYSGLSFSLLSGSLSLPYSDRI